MLFTPNYNVIYHGELHKAGAAFRIEDKDADELSAHGVATADKPPKSTTAASSSEEQKCPAKRPGRPKKEIV